LDKDYLTEYSAREREFLEKLTDVSKSGIENCKPEYKKRFKKLQEPIARSPGLMSLWPQIPLCGTLIITLSPFGAKKFSEYHGFEVADIPQLVNFARSTGRVAFVLTKDPVEYADLNFLDPIFTELNPPRDFVVQPLSPQELGKFKLAHDTFQKLSQDKLKSSAELLSRNARKSGDIGPNATLNNTALEGFSYTYAALDCLGHQDVTSTIRDALVRNPREAVAVLRLYGTLIVKPNFDLLGAIQNVSRELIENPFLPKNMEAPKAAFDGLQLGEIGKFLMDKLAPYPSGFEASRAMCDRFDHNDLYRVMSSLKQAVEAADYSSIKNHSKQLSDILDKAWESNMIDKRMKLSGIAILISLAFIGAAAARLTGDFAGVLPSLGFNLIDRYLGSRGEHLSEKVAKSLSPNYLVNIFNFKKDYKVKRIS
jgi:hypothetical protein